MNNRCNFNNNNNCHEDEIKCTLEKIIKLQKEAVKEELSDEMCNCDFLGERGLSAAKFNTRPLQLFTINDFPWHCPVERDEAGCNQVECEKTCVFRVEKIEGDCAFFRALIEEPEPYCYKSTDSFITIRLDRIAAVRCLKDAFVNICLI